MLVYFMSLVKEHENVFNDTNFLLSMCTVLKGFITCKGADSLAGLIFVSVLHERKNIYLRRADRS